PLKSGWYDVRIKLTAQDTSGNYITDYGRGWFEVRSFMFWANPANWNAKSGQNISFNLKAINTSNMESSFNTTVRIKKILYRSDWMQPPREVTGTHTLNGSINVDISTNMSQEATVVYTGGMTTSAGIYEFIFEATDPDGAIEETRTMIETRPFVSWVSLPNNEWNNRFGVNRTINLIVHASINYGDEGNSLILNPARTNITSVTKMGMFGGTPYKTRSGLNITNVAQDTDGKSVNITLSLTDWQEGSYDMQINAVDEAGSEVITHFWIEVEVATVGLPEFYRVMIPGDRIVTKRSSFYLSDSPSQKVGDMMYPGLTDDVASNFTNAKIGEINVLSRDKNSMEWMDWGLTRQPRNFFALVNLTQPRRLYVNFKDSNFSDNNATYTQNMTEGGIFNELDTNNRTVRRWNITSIGSDGSVVLEGLNALGNTYIIDPSISKSGKFIVSPNMQDSDWLKVDLDGNRQYFPEWNNRNNTYYILLADNATAGIYDTVLVSNTTNFTKNGINATNSSTPVAFGGNPIYFISLKKEGTDYMAQFTSYTAGRGALWLGTFEKGKPVNIPFLVQEPGSTTGIPNAIVQVDKLTWYMPGSDRPISPAANSTTNVNGLAIVSLNTTNIPTGQYLISYRVLLPGGQEKVATETWKMPGIEIRKFVIEAEFGNVGTISTHLISNETGGITVLYGTRIEPKGVTFANRLHDPRIYRVGWPFDNANEYYYNASDGHYYARFDGTNTSGLINNNSINLTVQGSNITYNFTQFIPSGTNVTIIGTNPQTVFEYWNISIWPGQIDTVDGSPYAMLKIDYLLDNQQDNRQNPDGDRTYRIGDRIFWAPGELNVIIMDINITSSSVILQTFDPKILYQSESLHMLLDGIGSNGEWASGGVIKLSSYRGYEVYGYNDKWDLTTMQNATYQQNCMGCWSPTLDHVLLVNGSYNQSYRVGVPITELGNEHIGLVSEWAGKIIFVNQSQGLGVYPYTDWAPDGDIYYVGTFTEPDVKVDLNNNGSNNDNYAYFVRLEDGSKNGVFNVTRGILDDDTDFTEARSSNHSISPPFDGPLDLFDVEQGQVVDMMRNNRLEERYITLGTLQGWPFGVPEITYSGDFANITTFSPRFEPFGMTENVTMYVGARKFTNEPINGNVSLEKLVVLFKVNQSDIAGLPMGGGGGSVPSSGGGGGGGGGTGGGGGMMIPDVYTNITAISPITDGIGVWKINYEDLKPVVGSFDSGQFIAMLNITDNAGNFEVIERQFMLQNRTSFGKGDYGCPQPCSGGSGGGIGPLRR
ncbi:MAG: hypothetical protein J5U19_07865, partial [Candidatus Methanoperedens sp.]|nr:hypothetical protein [Candidatus Methanoperedens sp.]